MEISLVGRIRNINLPESKVLLPLFEAVVNSIDAIEDAEIKDGCIKVFIKRGNLQTGLIDGASFSEIEGFRIVDNGIGFDDNNYQSFLTSDSVWKTSRGSKGIGRFLWLKAFHGLAILRGSR